MKKLILLTFLLAGLQSLNAQQYFTRTGTVEFFSATAVENIHAVNKQVSSVLDLDKMEFAFLVPIKAFRFEKALMQEHFNENYMESGEFPNGSFKGKISGLKGVNLKEDGTHRIKLTGTMTIHGVEKQIEEQAMLTIKDGKMSLSSNFILRPEDYAVKIPAGKRDNISESLDLTVNMEYAKK